MNNPQIVKFDNGFCIRFVRNNYKVLVWVQDITGRKMKSELINLPAVYFSTKKEAEEEIKSVVITYLLEEKDVDAKEIVGW